MLRFYFTCLEIDICEGVELCQHDVDIVSADSGGQYCNSFSVIFSCDGNELSGCVAELLVFQEFTDPDYTSGITYQYNFVGDFLWFQMNVES